MRRRGLLGGLLPAAPAAPPDAWEGFAAWCSRSAVTVARSRSLSYRQLAEAFNEANRSAVRRFLAERAATVMPNAVIHAVSQDDGTKRVLANLLYDEGQLDGLKRQMAALGKRVGADDLYSHVVATSCGREIARVPLKEGPRDTGEL